MNIKKKITTLAIGFAVLGVSGSAVAGICQGTSTTWDQFVENGCSGRGNWWGNWLGSDKRFGTIAFSGISTTIAAVNSSGTILT
ncbi:MAG TPA: hypothetical protein VHM25_28145, partial [Polyangiaceae bacterium]|nr:hypothetical protein [Polyangiaceae bacterium]